MSRPSFRRHLRRAPTLLALLAAPACRPDIEPEAQGPRTDPPVACNLPPEPEVTPDASVDPCPPCGRAFVPESGREFLEHYTAEDE